VAICIREELFKTYKFDICYREEGILGICGRDYISGFSFVIYSCYLPPESSEWGRNGSSYFNGLMSEVFLNWDHDSIIICGDLNARCGKEKDFVEGTDDIKERDVLT
jgi:hypothetical protein